jgi:uracil-DNA glycosylase
MPTTFDPGYDRAPYQDLVDQAPGATVYPFSAFRFEWGPIFHRGRLDGSARVLCIGQDPAQQEAVARRILIGTAGHRAQGFLAKLGFDASYVLINTFLYSVYGQTGGNQHINDPGITAYRNKWLAAIIQSGSIEAVVAFGTLADTAWTKFLADPTGATARSIPFQHVPHPTSADGHGGTAAAIAAAKKALLMKWNAAIQALRPAIHHPDHNTVFVPYGDDFAPADLVPIPRFDLPAGLPVWMCGDDGWAARTGTTAAEKRKTITIQVSEGVIP